MQKARRHHLSMAPTAYKFTVSGSLNSPQRGSFHFSVALLFTIGRQGVLSLGGWSPLLHARFHEPRATLDHGA